MAICNSVSLFCSWLPAACKSFTFDKAETDPDVTKVTPYEHEKTDKDYIPGNKSASEGEETDNDYIPESESA